MAGKHNRKRAAVWRRAGCQIPQQFPVRGKPVICPATQTALGREIGICRQKTTLQRIAARQLQQKTLTAAVTPNQKTNSGTSLFHRFQTGKEALYLFMPPNGYIRSPDTGHHPGAKRRKQRVQNTAGYFYFFGFSIHAETSSR